MEKDTAKQALLPSAKTKRPKKDKLTPFDSDALKLIRRGQGSIAAIAASTGVDAGLTRERMLALEKKGIVIMDSTDTGRVSLTIKGYNEFQPPTLETTLERKQARKQQAPVAETKMADETPIQQPKEEAPEARTIQETAQPQASAAGIETAKETKDNGRVDLAEMMARGAPRQNAGIPAPAATPQPTQRKNGESENCDLCKGAFTLSVNGGNPKFGHCFCGAAYHQDCFEAICEGDGRCVRCGRSLEKKIDRKSAEALRALKDPFA